jgi:hypothetical protein
MVQMNRDVDGAPHTVQSTKCKAQKVRLLRYDRHKDHNGRSIQGGVTSVSSGTCNSLDARAFHRYNDGFAPDRKFWGLLKLLKPPGRNVPQGCGR